MLLQPLVCLCYFRQQDLIQRDLFRNHIILHQLLKELLDLLLMLALLNHLQQCHYSVVLHTIGQLLRHFRKNLYCLLRELFVGRYPSIIVLHLQGVLDASAVIHDQPRFLNESLLQES